MKQCRVSPTHSLWVLLLSASLLTACTPTPPASPTTTSLSLQPTSSPLPVKTATPPHTSTPAPALDYVALGGDFTYANGWVKIFAGYLEEDFGMPVNFTNLSSHSSLTLIRWRELLRNDQATRLALQQAEVVTFDTSMEAYLAMPFSLYQGGYCKGDDNQECLRTALAQFEIDLNDFMIELLNHLDPSKQVLRTFAVGAYSAYVPLFWEIPPVPTEEQYKTFLELLYEADEIVRNVAEAHKVPIIDLVPVFQPDGITKPARPELLLMLGFSEAGDTAIADLLREAGYAPLSP